MLKKDKIINRLKNIKIFLYKIIITTILLTVIIHLPKILGKLEITVWIIKTKIIVINM